MRKPRQRRKGPYYKIQVFDESIKVWRDERKVFNTAEEAQDFIDKEISPQTARVMVVERDKRHVLEAISNIDRRRENQN